MSIWQIELRGDENAINFLEEFLSHSPYRIEKDEIRIFLSLPEVLPEAGKEELHATASNLLDVINGATKLYNPDYKPVSFSAISRIKEDGTREGFGYPTVGSPPRMEYFGFIPEDKTLVEWVKFALSDSEIGRALYLYRMLEANWKNLYMVLEIIEDDLGGETGLSNSNLIAADNLKLFKWTANSYKAIGEKARHGSLKRNPPPNPMTFKKANETICTLLKDWIKFKIDRSDE